jgi:hypothetical protein
MECYIHPSFDYLNAPQIISHQRAFIFEQLKQRSKSYDVYPGLEQVYSSQGKLTSVLEARGTAASGWTAQHIFKAATHIIA